MHTELTSNSDSSMSEDEQRQLAQYENVIERGLAKIREVGNALNEIRTRKLYRESFATFEEYVYNRWHLSTSHGYRLITAAKLSEVGSGIVLRLYESYGQHTVTRVSSAKAISHVAGCDLLEAPLPDQSNCRQVSRRAVEVALGPFEIKTLLLQHRGDCTSDSLTGRTESTGHRCPCYDD